MGVRMTDRVLVLCVQSRQIYGPSHTLIVTRTIKLPLRQGYGSHGDSRQDYGSIEGLDEPQCDAGTRFLGSRAAKLCVQSRQIDGRSHKRMGEHDHKPAVSRWGSSRNPRRNRRGTLAAPGPLVLRAVAAAPAWLPAEIAQRVLPG